MFFAILKKTLAPFGVLLVIVIALMMARARFPFLRVIPRWAIVLAVVVVIVAWAVFLGVKWMVERRRAKAIEDGIMGQAQAGVEQAAPANRSNVEALQRNLAEALALLKQGPQGKKALYTLPWYLIIGPPAIGKTTAIKNSGLNFPGMTTAKLMRGSGGTRNCDWWFSSDAILLDTAGRYAEGVDRSETEAEWFAFLDMLKTYRKHGPIDGLILAYSMEDLYEKDEMALINSARDLRQRMDEILDRLGWNFPVYVLFTKCDLVAGFAEYFERLSPVDRYQVWGAVYTPKPEGDQDAAVRFAGEFDLLIANLRAMRPGRMSAVSRSENWGRVFMFPEEYGNLKDRLVLFVETLFEANPYRRDVPIFRGTYFSSGMQEGKPFDLVVRKIHEMLGARADASAVAEQEPKDDAYFVRDLFAKVLKTDRDLVRLTSVSARKRSRLALFVSAGFLALGLLGCVWIGTSYVRLRTRMDRTQHIAEELMEPSSQATPVEELTRLDTLRERIQGSWRSFPLIVTDAVHRAAQDVYYRAITERILGPAERAIASDLDGSGGLPASKVRSALRTELMLLMPAKHDAIGWDAADLAAGLRPYILNGQESSKAIDRELKAMAAEFLALERPLPGLERSRELGRGARRLSDTHETQEFFRGIIVGASQEQDDLTLSALVPGQDILAASEDVRFGYSRDGWREYVGREIRNVKDTVDADNAIITLAGGEPTGRVPSADDLLSLYMVGYVQEWTRFLDSVRLARSYESCDDYDQDLRKLKSTSESPLFRMLRQAASAADPLAGGLDKGATQPEAIKSIAKQLEPLTTLFASPEGSEQTPAGKYGDLLADVQSEVYACKEGGTTPKQNAVLDAKNWVENFEADRKGQLAAAISGLLETPLDTASRVIVAHSRSARQRDLQQHWTDTYRLYAEQLAPYYPFRIGGKNADPMDVIGLLGPNGKMAAFHSFMVGNGGNPGRRANAVIEKAQDLQKDLRMTDSGFQARFTLMARGVRSDGTPRGDANWRKIDKVVLTINGGELVDYMNKREKSYTWRSDDPDLTCGLALQRSNPPETVASLQFKESVWDICKLFDAADQIDAQNAVRVVTWTFPDQGVAVEFTLTPFEDVDPFFLRGSIFRSFSIQESVSQ